MLMVNLPSVFSLTYLANASAEIWNGWVGTPVWANFQVTVGKSPAETAKCRPATGKMNSTIAKNDNTVILRALFIFVLQLTPWSASAGQRAHRHELIEPPRGLFVCLCVIRACGHQRSVWPVPCVVVVIGRSKESAFSRQFPLIVRGYAPDPGIRFYRTKCLLPTRAG